MQTTLLFLANPSLPACSVVSPKVERKFGLRASSGAFSPATVNTRGGSNTAAAPENFYTYMY